MSVEQPNITPPQVESATPKYPEDLDLCQRACSCNLEVRQAAALELYKKYHGLVRMITWDTIKRNPRYSVSDLGDLQQEAFIFMLKQAKSYIQSDGQTAFITWFTGFLDKKLQRCIDNSMGIPTYVAIAEKKLFVTNESNYQLQKPPLTKDETLQETHVSLSAIECSRRFRDMSSIDINCTPDKKSSRSEYDEYDDHACTIDEQQELILLTAEGQSDTAEEVAARSELKDTIAKLVFSTLTKREAKIITMRFGFGNGQATTLKEIGREFGVTKERIRQIVAEALEKLRLVAEEQQLRDFLY